MTVKSIKATLDNISYKDLTEQDESDLFLLSHAVTAIALRAMMYRATREIYPEATSGTLNVSDPAPGFESWTYTVKDENGVICIVSSETDNYGDDYQKELMHETVSFWDMVHMGIHNVSEW